MEDHREESPATPRWRSKAKVPWHCPFNSESGATWWSLRFHRIISCCDSLGTQPCSWVIYVSGFSYELRIWLSFPEIQRQYSLCEWLIVNFSEPDFSDPSPASVHPADQTWPGFQVDVNLFYPDFSLSSSGGPPPSPRRGGKASYVEQRFLASHQRRISEWCFVWGFHLKTCQGRGGVWWRAIHKGREI